MRTELEKKYNDVLTKYDFYTRENIGKIDIEIKKIISEFLEDTKNPAIYCNGGHTRMLMSDFVKELKKVKIIIDNYLEHNNSGGYIYIKEEDIKEYQIDAIIISSFKYRKEIFKVVNEKYKNIKILDIYEELEKKGVILKADYYYFNHPYHKYHKINSIQNEIIKYKEKKSVVEKAYIKLISCYLDIKDFKTAIDKIRELCFISDNKLYKELLKDVEDLYRMELAAFENIPEDHVLMLCMDGLRNMDLKAMNKLYEHLKNTSCYFDNAYSCSTSTFESLVPAYSGKDDMRTHYYEKNSVNENECKFLQLAIKQNRRVHVYGDVFHYIDGDKVEHEDIYQTITEKIWSFTLDAIDEEKGLYYIHELYESHFSFSNPYTKGELISEGTAMIFDFLPYKGGELRTDYKRQHDDSLRYLDDILFPFVRRINVSLVLYADHGNLILEKNSHINDIDDLDFTCSENWVKIPIVIRSKYQSIKKDKTLISLIDIDNIINKLLTNKNYTPHNKKYIKIMRSELYNPDFIFLFKYINKSKYLLAFEAFIFDCGYKLVIFSDGFTELYRLPEEVKVENTDVIDKLINIVKKDISVCDLKSIIGDRLDD